VTVSLTPVVDDEVVGIVRRRVSKEEGGVERMCGAGTELDEHLEQGI
jgi:hypothetical protein